MSTAPDLDRFGAARLPLFVLIPLLVLVPPETRGLSAAASAILIALAWIAGSNAGFGYRRATAGVILALAVVLPAITWSATPAAAVAPAILFLLAAAVGIAAARTANAVGFGERAVRLFVGGATLVALYGIFQSVYGLKRLAARIASDATIPDGHLLAERAATGRALGTFSTPAALGALLVLSMPVTLALAVSSRGRARWVWAAAGFVQLAALIASASATATATLVAALLLGAFAWSRTRRFALASAAIATLVLAGVVALRGPQILSTEHKDSSLRLRAGNFRSAAVMALDHPWLGVGPGGFAETYPRYRREGDNEIRHVHNLPLEMTAETGFVVGPLLAALFFFVFAVPLLRGRKEEKPWRRALAVGLAAFAVHNLVDYTAYMPSLLWSAALLRGLLATRCDASGSIDLVQGESPGRPAVSWGAWAVIVIAAVLQVLTGLAEDQRFDARAAAIAADETTAESMSARATQLAPWSADAALFLARATLGGDEIVEAAPERRALALRRAEHAVDVAPVSAAARGTRARARMVNGDVAGAYADLVEAVRLYPLHDGYRSDRDFLAAKLAQRPEAGVAP